MMKRMRKLLNRLRYPKGAKKSRRDTCRPKACSECIALQQRINGNENKNNFLITNINTFTFFSSELSGEMSNLYSQNKMLLETIDNNFASSLEKYVDKIALSSTT